MPRQNTFTDYLRAARALSVPIVIFSVTALCALLFLAVIFHSIRAAIQ